MAWIARLLIPLEVNKANVKRLRSLVGVWESERLRRMETSPVGLDVIQDEGNVFICSNVVNGQSVKPGPEGAFEGKLNLLDVSHRSSSLCGPIQNLIFSTSHFKVFTQHLFCFWHQPRTPRRAVPERQTRPSLSRLEKAGDLESVERTFSPRQVSCVKPRINSTVSELHSQHLPHFPLRLRSESRLRRRGSGREDIVLLWLTCRPGSRSLRSVAPGLHGGDPGGAAVRRSVEALPWHRHGDDHH